MEQLSRTPEKQHPRRRRGASAVEAAVIIPFVVFLLFAVIEYSWLMLKSHEVRNATRHAARVGVLEVSTTAGVQAEVTRLMTESGLESSGYTLTMTPMDPGSMAPGTSFTVTISVPYNEANNGITLTGVPLVPTPSTITESTTMLKEGAQSP